MDTKEVETLLQQQQIIAETINKIEVNFKKDSKERKTADYLKKRKDSLQSLWTNFQVNHEKLSTLEDKTGEYFTSNAYEKLKTQYDRIHQVLETYEPVVVATENRGVMSKSDELIQLQRTNFRALSRIVRNININNITEKWELEDKLKTLQARWKVIDDTHWEIDNLLIDSNIEYEQDYNKYEDIFEMTKRELNLKLNSTSHQHQSVPKIEIPTFSGNYTQWPTFMDLYCEAIHNNNSITKAQKMQHLKGKLRGEAERIVQHLHVSAENYDTCWDILTHRYNNLQLLFTKQIQTFMNQPAVQQNAADLKRLYDTSMETINAIHNLGIDVSTWDPILVHIITTKLDSVTYADYMETRKAPRELPDFNELMSFLENKFTALEPLNKKQTANPIKPKPTFTRESTQSQPARDIQYNADKYKRFQTKAYHANMERNCPVCKTGHLLIHCKQFQDMSPETKLSTFTQLNICKNCLYSHNEKQCNSMKRCRVCNEAHHTTLHDMLRDSRSSTSSGQRTSNMNTATKPINKPSYSSRNVNHVSGNFKEVLISTVLLKVRAADGEYILLRCLLDPGSQTNLISESTVQRLGLQRCHKNATVSGIGSGKPSHSNGSVQLDCKSADGNYQFYADALVMPKVLNNLPNYTFKQDWPHIQHIKLADPEFNISRPVDILLDAGVYAEVAMSGQLRGPANTPLAQQTQLGWVLMGNMRTFNCHALIHNLDDISQFWETEEISEPTNNMTADEQYCETLYANTTTRQEDGRYEVKLPMKPNFEKELGASKPQAVAQFKQLEKRMAKNKVLADGYKNFIDEYIALGHMKKCTEPREPSCYLPYHGVYKPESTTTQTRLVYNAASKTSSGRSLNQLMECGPNLQQDLQSLLLRWRGFEYVYTADIEKFFRQILVKEEDQHLQKIVWREAATDPITDYLLCTITYGTIAAPWLSMRTIKQLVMDDGHRYPLAADILNNQLYVDDLLGGSNCISEALEAQQQLIDLLKGGGFNLRKWASNSPSLLESLPQDLISQKMIDFKQAETNKTLGITWNPYTDQFTFKQTPLSNKRDVMTKRTLLSDMSKLYDPLGWLAPVTLKAKLIFQQAWTTTMGWDDPLPEQLQQEWEKFRQELDCIHSITIPRWIGNIQKPVEVHGFCDASENAYGCVIYCKSSDEKGQPVIRLIAAKTKLAPLKNPVSLPRLELCGALLLSRLMKKVIDTMKEQTVTIYGWTDSMVVLGWLQGDVSRWKTFIANRVTQITENMKSNCWRHVKSEDNPADCASRGLHPSHIINHPLWWEAPSWLKNDNLPPTSTFTTTEEEKKKKQVAAVQTKTTTFIEEFLAMHSSMAHATRVLSWVMRFINNTRDKQQAKRTSYLTTADIELAQNMIIRNIQHNNFEDDIAQLQKHNRVRSSSKILNLCPFLDKDGLLRVKGRLTHANLDQSQKHPMIIPNNHKLTELLIDQAHKRTLHGGARLTLAYLRNSYWILGGMKTVKKHLVKCVTCLRFKTQSSTQQMSDLPKPRVTPSRAFTHLGVDFTGSVEVKANKGRGIKTLRAYIVIFICLCTKATYLDLVTDLSTPTFLAALKRLCARRGTPKHIYSDNGTNFVGAARVLAKDKQEALQHFMNNDLLTEMAQLGIEWHFNAPAWPTAGGLWEAAVKSMKHHLKRVLGEQKLTYEEFTTLLVQIEGCLNSRPLVALTNDTDDINVLTPGHFLIGDSILAPPLSSDADNTSLTTRWRLTENMFKDFWKRWSKDYLQTLQVRGKWHKQTKNIEIGDVVLVKEDQLPPAKWLMGRVTDTHPGSDGLVRVVTLKTKASTMKRPITKLLRLPVDQQSNSDQQQTDTSNEPQQPLRQQRPKQSMFIKCLSTLLLIMACITPSTQQIANVTALDPGKFVYFDKISDMQIIQDDWKMVVYYNMSTYWQSLNNIEKYVNHLDSLCKQEVAYQAIASQFHHELNELRHYNEVLQTEHGRRVKRGLIDGVGYVANSLFGVLDERFAEKYNSDIKKLQDNENHLLNLYKQHTSIIEGAYNLLKRNEEVLNKQFSSINRHLIETEQRVKQDYQNNVYITATALAANMIVSNLRNVQQLLLELVTDVRNGRVDTHLLKPDEFEAQMNIISGQLPSGLSLPCVNSYGCIRLMYKVSTVHVRLTEDFLLFEVKIPLVAADQYELSRILPLRRQQGSNLISVVPTTPYLAVNLRKDLIIPITADDMSTCMQSHEHQLLCNINLPIYDIKNTESICEAQIISNKAPSSCRTVVSDCRDEWVQLHSRGSWLFTCCEECTTRIFCPAGITSQALRNTGIITLSDGCMLRGKYHMIHSHNNFHSEIHLDEHEMYIPESGINSFLSVSNISTLNIIPESHDKQLQTLKNSIDVVKTQQENLNLQTTSEDVHHYVMYGFMTFCLLAAGAWGGFRIRQIWQKASQPTDTPTTIMLEMQHRPSRTVRDVTHTNHGADFEDNIDQGDVKVDRATSPV